MKRYYRLQDSRVHSNPNACATGEAMTSFESREMYRGGDQGSCSGRLGAAVQRVMAMRERHASQNDVKGIGAMKDLYNSCPYTSNSTEIIQDKRECFKCESSGLEIQRKEVSVVGTQSMTYTRFLLPKDWCNTTDHENEDGGHHSFASNGTHSPQICVDSGCVDEDKKENTGGKKKGTLRYVCRQLLGLGRKLSGDV